MSNEYNAGSGRSRRQTARKINEDKLKETAGNLQKKIDPEAVTDNKNPFTYDLKQEAGLSGGKVNVALYFEVHELYKEISKDTRTDIGKLINNILNNNLKDEKFMEMVKKMKVSKPINPLRK